MAVAKAELAAAGIADPTIRQTVVRAADIATRPVIPDEHGPVRRQLQPPTTGRSERHNPNRSR